ATDRVYRIGQTQPVTVHRITVPNTIEDRILTLQEQKRKIVQRAFGEGVDETEKLGRLSAQDLMYLFRRS
ncbi:Helicase-like transcription factor chr28, partial [Tieghemiomyces parasiticus]